MRPSTEHLVIEGAAGRLQLAIDLPNAELATLRGIAILCHPHPLFGGTMDNKIITTLARCMVSLGYASVRSNFRGVGESQGEHDHGAGEAEDTLTVLTWAQQRFGKLPMVLCGFSFGAHVATRVAAQLANAGTPAQRLVLVGTACGSVPGLRTYNTPDVPADSIVIHGEVDETVPLVNVLDWARPQTLPVIVVPGADHFFHGKLQIIRDLVVRNWRDDTPH